MKTTAALGVLLSDVVAQVYHLATEEETGKTLQLRLLKLKTATSSLLLCAEQIVAERCRAKGE